MILERIAREAGANIQYLELIARTASLRYKSYDIPKRNGKLRRIDHPSRELKFLQRSLVRMVFSKLPVHQAATAYRQGASAQINATLHVCSDYLLKTDFRDFFPSIKAEDVRILVRNNLDVLSDVVEIENDLDLIAGIVCRNGNLTIGAPSSPVLSNAVLFPFDAEVSNLCRKLGVVYSRYADDISLSTNEPNVLCKLHELVRELIGQMKSPDISLNEEKSAFTSRKRKRIVTGIYLTSDRKISLGRQKKRKIRTMLYLFRRGELSVEDTAYLRGYLAYANAIETEFIDRLKNKFGADIVSQAQHAETTTRKRLGALK